MLFTVRAGLGHLHPLAPIAHAAEVAGHEVRFAASHSTVRAVEQVGFRCHPAGIDIGGEDLERLVPTLKGTTGNDRAALFWRYVFAEHSPKAMIPAILALASSWRPDVIVREDTEFGGCIVAECLGIPHAAVQTTAFRPHFYASIAEPLNQRRSEVGLPLDRDSAMPFRYLFLSPFPTGYLNQEVTLPATTHQLRPVPFDRSGTESLPNWLEHLPDRPTVYISLGTVSNNHPEIFHAFLDGLRDEPLNLIVTVGRDQDPGQFGSQPEHIHIEHYIPQTLLFQHCSLVVTHGGSGTVMAALTYGLPLVIVPIEADQPENAERCAALRLAGIVQPAELTPERAREVVLTVLDDPEYRIKAERMRAEIAALPGPEHGARLLERLATAKAPLLTRG